MNRLTIAVILAAVLGVESRQTVVFEPNAFRREGNDEPIPGQEIGNCQQDEVIRLSGLGLKSIPKNWIKSSTIKSILLNDNELSTIDLAAFDETPRLECLNLAGNRIPLEALRAGHPRLKKLILDYQRLPEFEDMVPQACSPLGHFPNLTSLSLRGTDRECFDAMVHNFPALSTIDLSDNNIQNMSVFESALADTMLLRNIHLERNKIESLQVDYIGNVEALYLNENPLRSVQIDPANTNLRVLSLAGCSMSLLNGDLYAPSLTVLDLSRNRIQALPADALEYMPQLESLNLSGNELTVFPDFAHPSRLKELRLNFNRINRILSKIQPVSLVALSLRGNGISVIRDDAFSGLAQLEELDLSQNQLRTLPAAWHFGTLALHTVNLESNDFQTISDMHVHTLLSLRALRVKGNVFRAIDADTLTRLPEGCELYVA